MHEITKEESPQHSHALSYSPQNRAYRITSMVPSSDQNSTTPTITLTNGGLSLPNMNPMPRQLSPPHEHSLPWITSNNSLGRLNHSQAKGGTSSAAVG